MYCGPKVQNPNCTLSAQVEPELCSMNLFIKSAIGYDDLYVFHSLSDNDELAMSEPCIVVLKSRIPTVC
jgi:hypothetical protein